MCALIVKDCAEHKLVETFDTNKDTIFYPLVSSRYKSIFDHCSREGFWDSNGPIPRSTDITIDPEFIKRVKYIIRMADLKSNLYLLTCNLCNYTCGETSGYISCRNMTFKVRNDIIHYYEKHNVLPSEEFYKFVMRINTNELHRQTFMRRYPTIIEHDNNVSNKNMFKYY